MYITYEPGQELESSPTKRMDADPLIHVLDLELLEQAAVKTPATVLETRLAAGATEATGESRVLDSFLHSNVWKLLALVPVEIQLPRVVRLS